MTENFIRTDEDHQLAIAVRQHDQRSISLLYDKYAPALMGIINRIVHDKEIAEEILKTTFLKIWDQINSFDASKNSLFTWLMNISRYTALEELRSAQLKNPQLTDSVYKQAINSNDDDHSFDMALQKTAFDLIYYKGLSCMEAAAKLNVSVEELKINIRIAIKNLKTINVL